MEFAEEFVEEFVEEFAEEFAEKLGTELIARLPFETDIAELCDAGKIERYQNKEISNTIEKIKNTIKEQKDKNSIETIVNSAGGSLSPAWNKSEEPKKKFKLTPV